MRGATSTYTINTVEGKERLFILKREISLRGRSFFSVRLFPLNWFVFNFESIDKCKDFKKKNKQKKKTEETDNRRLTAIMENILKGLSW